jgi:amidase
MAAADLELCYMTATEAIAKFKAKKVLPVELIKTVIAHCEAVNPKLNAIT